MRNRQIEEALFLLLRVGLGGEIQDQKLLQILYDLSSQQWDDLISMSDNHGVSAIALDGLNILHEIKNVETKINKESLLNWCGQSLLLEQRNSRQIEVMKDLCGRIEKELCPVLVFKGQALASYYPNPLHRSCGDIDCYLFGNYELGNALCKEYGAEVDTSWYKHSEIYYKGELFENHQYLVTTRDGHDLKHLNEDLLSLLGTTDLRRLKEDHIVTPNAIFNSIFLTYHSLGHFVSEGLRLKQVLDWVQFVRVETDRIDWDLLYRFCERYHFRVFLDVMMDIAVNVFGVTIETPQVITQSDYTHKVLLSILYDNDYVFSVDKNEWKQRLHLIRNVFKYRWKYEDIYQYSIYKHLSRRFFGFLLQYE